MATTSPKPDREPPRRFVTATRCRGVALPAGFALVVVGTVAAALLPSGLLPSPARLGIPTAGVALLALAVVLSLLPVDPIDPAAPPRIFRTPVGGTWEGCNSPANRVPSHGTHEYGQTYAIDLVPDTRDQARPTTRLGGGFRRPEAFPGQHERATPAHPAHGPSTRQPRGGPAIRVRRTRDRRRASARDTPRKRRAIPGKSLAVVVLDDITVLGRLR